MIDHTRKIKSLHYSLTELPRTHLPCQTHKMREVRNCHLRTHTHQRLHNNKEMWKRVRVSVKLRAKEWTISRICLRNSSS